MNEPISVAYTFVDGAHFFTSEDAKWAGLCAASTDMQAAWDDVAVQLSILSEVNHGVKKKFKPVESLEDFVKKLLSAFEALEVEEVKARAAKAKAATSSPKPKLAQVKTAVLKPKKSVPARAHMIWQTQELAAA